jgi:hypothetical protein
MTLRIVVLLTMLFSHVASGTAAAAEGAEAESLKIQYLVASIESLQGAQFMRNGKAYEAKQAADHLRLKLRRAGERCRTAEAFIRYCASASSMSGKPYEIRFANGEQVTTEQFLRRKLAQFKPGSGAEQPANK